MASLQNILYSVNIRSTTGKAVDAVNDLQIIESDRKCLTFIGHLSDFSK